MILSTWKKDSDNLLVGTVPPFVSVALASEAHQIFLGNDKTKIMTFTNLKYKSLIKPSTLGQGFQGTAWNRNSLGWVW